MQKQYPDKEVINSNSKDNVVILTDETGTNFRPDSVCYNEDGGYRIIHDNKDLSGTDFSNSNLKKASFLNAKLDNIIWKGADISEAKFDIGVIEKIEKLI